MIIEIKHSKTGKKPLKLIANPIKMTETPVSYRHPPPLLGEHTDEILTQHLKLSVEDIKNLKDKGIV